MRHGEIRQAIKNLQDPLKPEPGTCLETGKPMFPRIQTIDK